MVDLVYNPDGGPRPEVLITDQGSYSDVVFGILTLLGFDYRPALADLPDAKLWRIDARADYSPLDRAARGRIELDKVRRHCATPTHATNSESVSSGRPAVIAVELSWRNCNKLQSA